MHNISRIPQYRASSLYFPDIEKLTTYKILFADLSYFILYKAKTKNGSF